MLVIYPFFLCWRTVSPIFLFSVKELFCDCQLYTPVLSAEAVLWLSVLYHCALWRSCYVPVSFTPLFFLKKLFRIIIHKYLFSLIELFCDCQLYTPVLSSGAVLRLTSVPLAVTSLRLTIRFLCTYLLLEPCCDCQTYIPVPRLIENWENWWDVTTCQ